VLVAASAVFAVKWGFGNAIADRSDTLELDEIALRFAPADPLAHRRNAAHLNKTFIRTDADRALTEYEIAARLSPNDYLAWLALGNARERSGDGRGAESALRYAADLAPNYASVQWALGNTLLRRNKTDQGFAELSKAIRSDTKYALPASVAAMQIFSNDAAAAIKALGNFPNANAAIAQLVAGQERFSEAAEIWVAIPAESRVELKNEGEKLRAAMLAAKDLRNANAVNSTLPDAVKAEIGKVYNGGFEAEVLPDGAAVFDWQIQKGSSPVIGLSDTEKHSGQFGLAVVFNSPAGKMPRTISQTIAVEPGTSYNFRFFYRNGIKSGPGISWRIVNAEDNSLIAESSPLEFSDGWLQADVPVAVPENCDGIIIRLAAAKCAALDCRIAGPVWFDDIELTRAG
jgi:Tfp pilus assembly protein PilF